MGWVQIIALVLQILKIIRDQLDSEAVLEFATDLKMATRQDEWVATDTAKAIGDGAIIKWIWEHRDEILAFVLVIIDMFKGELDEPLLAAKRIIEG